MDEKIKQEFREHTIYARVTKRTYGLVYHASQNLGVSMSEITNMCIEKALDEVINDIRRKASK